MKENCEPNRFMRWLGYSGHKWKHENMMFRKCKRCGIEQKLVGYDGFTETWRNIK